MSERDPSVLIKPLRLELEKGCDNRTVAGGMDNLISHWEAALGWLRAVAPMNRGTYSQLSADGRAGWLKVVISKLEGGGEPEAPAAAPAPAARARLSSLDLPLQDAERVISTLPNLRAALLKGFAQMGAETVRDLLWRVPRDYRDYSQVQPVRGLQPKTKAIVKVKLLRIAHVLKGNRLSSQATVADDSGALSVIWFGQEYPAKTLKAGAQLFLSGRVTSYRGQRQMGNPEYDFVSEDDEEAAAEGGGRMVPLYGLSEGVTQKMMRYAVREALAQYADEAEDWVPAGVRGALRMMELPEALRCVHFPRNADEQRRARNRLVFDELFLYQLEIQNTKRQWRKTGSGVAMKKGRMDAAVKWLRERIDFKFTKSQADAASEITEDMSHAVPMSRLVQGEVGSGKTAVALAAMVASAASGHKAAMLVPTEIVAGQHYINAVRLMGAEPEGSDGNVARVECALAEGGNLKLGLLTGKIKERARKELKWLLEKGEVDMVIGTHALLQEDVAISGLGLVVIDEQHRFGVDQRAALANRSPRPHTLALSATPIPRTLQLTTYGDMDISSMRKIPQGKRKVRTRLVQDEAGRREAYGLVRSEAAAGRQAFVVCPFVEPSEEIAARSAVREHERLRQGALGDLKLDLLHGRMGVKERQEVVARFRANETQVLVATSIIEVGVDVPNATVMVVESAERFGLAQLHQLRGRVGRAGDQAHCLLFSDSAEDDALKRLRVLERTSDGFKLADRDLEIRGPGEYLGDRQSGWGRMRIARPSDTEILKYAREQAERALEEDPELLLSEPVRAELERFGIGSRVEIS